VDNTFVNKVYVGLKLAIAHGKYDINEFLIEQEIADQYGVSKGTAGEALHRLCMEGDLVSYPRKGYLITILNESEYQQIQRLRFTIESLVIKILIKTKSDEEVKSLYRLLAKQNGDELGYYTANAFFHISLSEMTGDKFIHNSIINLTNSLTHTRAYFLVVKQPDDLGLNHRKIIDSINMRDVTMAITYLKKDLGIEEEL